MMTICHLDGSLKYNVYGPNWDVRSSYPIQHYNKVIFCNDKIVAAYSGGNYNSSDEYNATKFFVFDLHGDYIRTLETGYKICDYCYDKNNNRIIMALEDEIQFAYFELEELFE